MAALNLTCDPAPPAPPVREVVVLVQANEDDIPQTLGNALRSLPPTAERASIALAPPPNDGTLSKWHVDFYPRGRIEYQYIGQPSVIAFGRLTPEFDEYTAIYLHPLAPTTYRRPRIETVRARHARFLREAWDEVNDILPGEEASSA